MDKSYRIHTNISSDTFLNVNMRQDFDFLEVLSLKLRQKDAYKLHSSNYGVVVGRVLANDAFGIPNAKISVFIEKTDSDTSDIDALYPYNEVTTKDKKGRRYNLLPDYSDDECYRVVGTFPNKRLMLDDDTQLEVYDKYWKYTTVTNNAGDYMLFGIPTGSVTVHIDIDLSDIGILSQKPRDFEYKGYNLTLFDSPSQFKESTNLDDLAQIFSQDKSIFVYPFWGDSDNGIACITRSDVQIQYKFEPTCVFMGSIISDNEGHSIGHKCAPDIESGENAQLIGGSGTIEMIRKTPDGLVEEYQIQGSQLIDENGVWCYQIPMNLDYVGTDEYGNIVPTDNPSKGIPTRTQVRFRISKNETSDEGISKHTAKYLVPMNPRFSEESENIVDLDKNSGGLGSRISGEIPVVVDKGEDIEKMYTFGSATPISCFRDLYWNNVYSVKNYIPKVQVAHRVNSKNYGALKGANLTEDQNPIPFNKININIPFLYMVVCILYTIMVWVVSVVNMLMSAIHFLTRELCLKIPIINKKICPFGPLGVFIGDASCITMSAGGDEGNIAYYPGCSKKAMRDSSCPEDMRESGCVKKNEKDELMDKVQRNLALEFKIVKLDLYQDWINGCLYMPLWYWRKAKKKTFLFFTISKAKNDYCSSESLYSRLKSYVSCNIKYIDRSLTARNNKDSMPDNEKRWHKNRNAQVRFNRGLIKPVENRDGLTVYYYSALQATSDNDNSSQEMSKRDKNFKAVRLYATDIILLGNLDPKNIYGIPQFFKCLPSTTSNVPPIATIEETVATNDNDEVASTFDGAEDSGVTITTGMDWNHNGASQTPAYKTGLFMDLACTYANTKPKACINVERLSELGVNLDMNYKMAYHDGGNETKYGSIDNDGFISKYELDDMENRSMFATLNHIGFVPQEYQDSINGYTTQVYDKNTNYLIPKFKYIYPVDFDGRLQTSMSLYKTNKFNQALFDEKDEAYLTFRLGAEDNGSKQGFPNKLKNSEGRIRHFYHVYNQSLRDMPLYNNSFYFYFGIKKGSTAIDKFNEMFYSPCFKNSKMPFTLDITSQGRSYCPEAYSNRSEGCTRNYESDRCKNGEPKTYHYGDNKNNAYGFIRVKSDDIKVPYSYTLYDSFGDVVISEDDMMVSEFVIGGDIDSSGNTLLNCEGAIRYQNSPCETLRTVTEDNVEVNLVLDNQEYTLEVIDFDGKKITQKVALTTPKINGEYVATKLGAKYYSSASTRIDYICNDDNAYYGKIEMRSFSIDGYSCEITDINYIGYANDYTELVDAETTVTVEDDSKGRYIFCVTGKSEKISDNLTAYLELSAVDGVGENAMRNCLCDNNTSSEDTSHPSADNDDNPINLIKELQNSQYPVNMRIDSANKNEYFLGIGERKDDEGNVVGTSAWFFVYQPNMYEIRITQGCPDCMTRVTGNSSSEIIDVANGEQFITELNSMPINFMLGTNNDNENADISSTSYFYDRNAVTSPTGRNIKGWYGTHEESSYMFNTIESNKTYLSNQSTWEDLINGSVSDVSTPNMKRYILKLKFDKMFDLSEAAYVTNDSSRTFEYRGSGGISPLLYRTLCPQYEDENAFKSKYVLNDGYSSTCTSEYPNIVGENFSTPFKNKNGYSPGFTPGGPRFNSVYNDSKYIGNYFAAFTRDGSYIENGKIDGRNISIERLPSFASVSPMRGNSPKMKGMDVINNITNFEWVYNKKTQTLSNDKQRTTLPYLRALFVDRRFDYDLTILAPYAMFDGMTLYKESEKGRERTWMGGRVSGWTYNGIEMSYDDEYNIISAHLYESPYIENEEYSAATFNKRLEYTYKYDSADICADCGYQAKGIGDVCPVCGSQNINKLHGENIINGNHELDRENFCTANSAYTLDNAITYYHKSYGTDKYDWDYEDTTSCSEDIYGNVQKLAPRWGRWNKVLNDNGEEFGYTPEIDGDENEQETEMIPLFKEFYSSYFARFDIRHLYWSLFNYNRLKIYTEEGKKEEPMPNQQINGYGRLAIDNEDNPFYVFHYPSLSGFVTASTTYNGDFNREDVVGGDGKYHKKAYPTKRYIDVGNLPVESLYSYITDSCSYGIRCEIDDDGKLRATTEPSENNEVYMYWNPPITIATQETANVTYTPVSNPCGNRPFVNCVKFTAGNIMFEFKYNEYLSGDFQVFTRSPRLIQVLPYIDDKGIDGIGFLKTSNPSTSYGGNEFDNKYGDGYTLDDAIKHITLNKGTFTKEVEYSDGLTSTRVIRLPDGVSLTNKFKTKYGLDLNLDGNVFFEKDGELMASDDEDFPNISFRRMDLQLVGEETHQNVKVFAVLVDREYMYDDDDNLVRHIRTIETSELFDCRDAFMKIFVKDDENDGTYVQKNGNTNIQVITFDLYFDMRETTSPVDRQNEILSQFNNVTYLFKFTNASSEKIEVSPHQVTEINKEIDGEIVAKIVRITVRWDSSMGIIADSNWSVNTSSPRAIPIEMSVTTQSGFVYLLTNFSLILCNSNGGQETIGSESRHYYTHCIISNTCNCSVEGSDSGPI